MAVTYPSTPLLASGALPEEALYFMNTANAAFLLTEPNTVERAAAIKDHAVQTAGQNIHLIPIARAEAGSISSARVEIDEDMTLDPKLPCLIIFTSGTTGRPKGVTDPSELFLAYRPVHWIGGAYSLLVRRVLTGSWVHFLKRRPEPANFWEILKEGRITGTSLPPTLFKEIEDYYLTNIRYLPSQEHDEYVSGAAKLRFAINSGSALNPSAAHFWKKLTNLKIRNVYTSTEFGSAALMAPIEAEYVDRCIGRPLPGVETKLSDGDEGEMLVKSSTMFTHYINNEAATRDAFDEEGFLKTGDLAQHIGDLYFFKVRANHDWIRFWHFKIPVLELEERLIQLPYISEAYVLPVLDHEAQGLAAALVRLRGPHETLQNINLRKIREDLASNMELYKLPALLFILKDGEEVPKSASEKVMKAQALEKYFHLSD
ncbi:acetyl-CoA synthetase-like protein [Penicillium longicatenatum]|nr:acetyl-CoA synthetase-like protein [Penicillium longicatenatum]